ncbi:hypothetical protein OQA88_10213 [Cercophora sp. LCS_1]
MAPIAYSPTTAQNLSGRVVIVTGGAQGIGAATATLLHSLGAHVVFGDIGDTPGTALESSLSALKATNPSFGTAHFHHTDVTSYTDQLVLFEIALTLHGRVDAAITCAAQMDGPSWFAGVTLDAVRTESSAISKAVSTNLVAPMMLTRLALAFIGASPPFPGSCSDFVPSVTYASSLSGLTPT